MSAREDRERPAREGDATFQLGGDGLDLRGGRRGGDGAEAFEERAPRVRAKIFRLRIFHVTQWKTVNRL